MQDDFLSLMKNIAPDLVQVLDQRLQILCQIDLSPPIGRRALASQLHMSEREIRSCCDIFKKYGYVIQDKNGMSLSSQGSIIAKQASHMQHNLNGLVDLEKKISQVFDIPDVHIIKGDADTEPFIINTVTRKAGELIKPMIKTGYTIAVTGGMTMASFAENLKPSSKSNVMIVPAQGGVGQSMELNANTIAEKIADKLNSFHRILHLPSIIDDKTLQNLRKLPDIDEVVSLIERADVIVHSVGVPGEVPQTKNVSQFVRDKINSEGAVSECFGCYYDINGKKISCISSVSSLLGTLKESSCFIEIAVGSHKALAVKASLIAKKHRMLVIDEGIARKMIS